MKKLKTSVSVISLIIFVVVIYTLIISLSIGGFFLAKDLLLPFYGTNTVIKLSFLAGSVAFAAALPLTLMIVKSKTTTICLLLMSTVIGVGLIVLSVLAIFPIYSGLAKIIFGWQSFLVGLGLSFFTVLMAFACSPRLTQSSLKTKKVKTKIINPTPVLDPLEKIAVVVSTYLPAMLATVAIVWISQSVRLFILEKALEVNYFTWLIIYFTWGLMIIKQAGPKTIEKLAQLTIILGGFSFFLFIMPLLTTPGLGRFDQALVSLKTPFMITSILMFVFLLLLINNVLQNPKVNWLPEKERNPYWRLDMVIGIIDLMSVIGAVIIVAKRYRSFLKIVAVSLASLLLGRLVILEFELATKESQAIVWYFGGFFVYLYLGRKLIQSRRKSVIFALLAASITAGAILTLFSLLSFFNLYSAVSQAILTWPAIISLIILAALIFAGYDLYYRALPGQSCRQQIVSWLKSSKDFVDVRLGLVIILSLEIIGFFGGIVTLIFQACLDTRFSVLKTELGGIGGIAMGFCAFALFLTGLVIVSLVFREEMLAKMSDKERKEFEQKEARSFLEMTLSRDQYSM